MYYKKQGSEPPIIKDGCVYEESYFYDGYLFLKYSVGNVPSEELTEITQGEYETNKPNEGKPHIPEPTEQEIMQAEMLLNQQQIISKQTEIDMTLAELLLNQQGVDR